MDIKEKIKFLRSEKKLTQKELATLLNLSKNIVCEWEKGRAEPRIDTLKQMATIFDCSTDYLLDLNNDFDAVFPTDTPTLSNDEQTVIDCMRNVSDEDRKLIIENAKFVRYTHSKNKKEKFN